MLPRHKLPTLLCVLFKLVAREVGEIMVFACSFFQKLKQTWFIKYRRENYIINEHARVSEKHFADSDFVVSRTFAASLGYNRKFRLQLKPDAVPTILPEPTSKTPSSSKRKLTRTSMALEKRRRFKVKYFSSIDYICCDCICKYETHTHLTFCVYCLFITVHPLHYMYDQRTCFFSFLSECQRSYGSL